MDGLEVEPVCDAGLEVDHDVFSHGVAVGKSPGVEIGEGNDRQLDGRLPNRLVQVRILQHGCQRLAGETRQDERSVILDANRSTAEAQAEVALPFLPIPLGENLHAGIEKPNELTAEPDEQRCVEQAVLSHVKVAVPGDDPGLRVPSGPKQPPQT